MEIKFHSSWKYNGGLATHTHTHTQKKRISCESLELRRLRRLAREISRAKIDVVSTREYNNGKSLARESNLMINAYPSSC